MRNFKIDQPVFWYDENGNKVTGKVYQYFAKQGFLTVHPDHEPEHCGLVRFTDTSELHPANVMSKGVVMARVSYRHA